MKPTEPIIPGRTLKITQIAKHQPEYNTLPAYVYDDGSGMILSRWHLTDEERKIVSKTGDVYLWVHTFGSPMQPVNLQVEVPD